MILISKQNKLQTTENLIKAKGLVKSIVKRDGLQKAKAWIAEFFMVGFWAICGRNTCS